MSSPPPPDADPSPAAAVDLAGQLAALQAKLAAIKTETAVKVASLEDTIAGLAHENTLLKRRLFGNRTERSHTSELQLALGDLLAGEAELKKALDEAVGKVKDALEPEPSRQVRGPRPRARRDLSLSKLPRVVVARCPLQVPAARAAGQRPATSPLRVAPPPTVTDRNEWRSRQT